MTTTYRSVPCGLAGEAHIEMVQNGVVFRLESWMHGKLRTKWPQKLADQSVFALEYCQEPSSIGLHERWVTQDTAYQGGHIYPNMFTANTAIVV